MESSFGMLITSSLVQFSGVVSARLSKLEAMSTGVFISPLGKAVLIKQSGWGNGEQRQGEKKLILACSLFPLCASAFICKY